MHATSEPAADHLAAAAASGGGVVAWYAQGFSDRLGDRLLLFDNSGSQPLELLRIAERLTADPAFETALRERVERLEPFHHPAFARVRGVSVLAEPVPQLALVSEHIPGERLSNILRAARRAGVRPDPGTALWLIRQLLPAVAALHEMGAGITHGALGPDRIIVTPGGDLVVTEYVFAQAIEQLPASADELWRTLGVAASRGDRGRRLDQRADVEQVALLALAVLLGRPLRPHEYPVSVGDLLDEACDVSRWSLAGPLRGWLGTALAVGEHPRFDTARQALTTLEQVLPRISGTWTSRLLPQNLESAGDAPPDEPGARRQEVDGPAACPVPAAPPTAPAADAPSAAQVRPPADQSALIQRLRRRNLALTGLAGAEAACLAMVLLGASGRADRPQGDVPVLTAGAVSAPAAQTAPPIPVTTRATAGQPPAAAVPPPMAPAGRIAVIAPVELTVYAGGHRRGRGRRTTFSLPPGEHVVTLINEAQEIRIVRRVQIVSGETLSLRPLLAP